MAEDYFLKITGSVQGEMKGESLKAGKEGQTDIGHFTMGAHQPGSWGTYGGGGTGKVSFADISFSSGVSVVSPKILKAMANHEALTEVVFTARKGVGDKQEDYYIITLTDAVFTTYDISAASGGLNVSGSVNYKKIKIGYKEQKPDNTLGAEALVEFDQALGTVA